MERSVSWIMEYHRRPAGGPDRVGGLPGHLPYVWPRCQTCQRRMAFVGQLYASEWLTVVNHLALQFYVCDACRKSFGKAANNRVPIHMEALPRKAAVNTARVGTRCPAQPLRYISYAPINDSLDQWTFNRRKLSEAELPDKHLRRDKIGGLFPYDCYECPRITPQNRMLAQFTWKGIGGPIYLYQSAREGIYAYPYR